MWAAVIFLVYLQLKPESKLFPKLILSEERYVDSYAGPKSLISAETFCQNTVFINREPAAVYNKAREKLTIASITCPKPLLQKSQSVIRCYCWCATHTVISLLEQSSSWPQLWMCHSLLGNHLPQQGLFQAVQMWGTGCFCSLGPIWPECTETIVLLREFMSLQVYTYGHFIKAEDVSTLKNQETLGYFLSISHILHVG